MGTTRMKGINHVLLLIRIIGLLQRAADDIESNAALIAVSISVASLVVVVLSCLWYLGYTKRMVPCVNIPPLRRKNIDEPTPARSKADFTQQPSIRIVYTHDHVAHKATVDSLTTLIKMSTNYLVIVDETEQTDYIMTTGSSISASENSDNISVEGGTLGKIDVICIVHSEWANKLISLIGSGEVSNQDLTNTQDTSFVKSMNAISQDPVLTSKVLSVRYEYTPSSAVIREPFLGPQFNLPANTDAFIKHLLSRADSSDRTNVNINIEQKVALFSSINASFAYQSKHKSWLFSKLFYLRQPPSSDDSGFAGPRRHNQCSRSVRSHSAETVQYFQCTSNASSRRQLCSMCNQKQTPRLRTNSCDLSFYPPESIVDGTSERLSLLESKFADINSRYYKKLDHNISIDEDCLTLQDQRV